MKNFILTLTFLLFMLFINGQIIKDFPFPKYPAIETENNKAPLKLSSHKLGKTFRTIITETYKSENVNFGGHYIVILWGCGTGCSDGILADVNTGLLYSLPLNENNSNRGANVEENENIIFKAKSKLFICYRSTRETNDIVRLDYYYFVFNEKSKNFILTKCDKKYTKEE